MPKLKKTTAKPRSTRARALLVAGIVVVIVAIIGVVAWSIYNFQVKPYSRTVLNFNGKTFDMRYFVNTLEVYYGRAPSDIAVADFADYVEQQIERNETIIQGAAVLGITIDKKEIEQIIKNAGLKVTTERVAVAMAEELLARQVPATQPQYHVEAMLLESEAAGQQALARLQAGETFDAVAGELSRVQQGTIFQGDLGWVTPREADLRVGSTGFGALVAGLAAGVPAGPVYDESVQKQYGFWVGEAIELEDPADDTVLERAHLAGLLLGSEEEALDVIARLNAGADIDELAKELSQFTGAADNGAELGWISRGQDPGGFDQVFDHPLNTVIGPMAQDLMPTRGGWWVLNVVESDAVRALTSAQYDMLVDDFIGSCAAALQASPDYAVENLLTAETRDFAINRAVSAQGEGSILIGTTSLPEGEAGLPYSFRLKAYGDTGDAVWSIEGGRLPTGLTLDPSTGEVSGTPEMAGGGAVSIKVASRLHHNIVELTFRVRLAVKIATDSLPDGEVGVDYNVVLEAFGDAPGYTWSLVGGALPDGIELSASGLLGGAPTASGTYAFTLQVDDGMRQATRELTITVP